MLNPNETFTTYEMTLQMFKAMNISPEGVDFNSKETIKATDNFAMDNDFYFFPSEGADGIYKNPQDGDATAGTVEFFTFGFVI